MLAISVMPTLFIISILFWCTLGISILIKIFGRAGKIIFILGLIITLIFGMSSLIQSSQQTLETDHIYETVQAQYLNGEITLEPTATDFPSLHYTPAQQSEHLSICSQKYQGYKPTSFEWQQCLEGN
jgi:hypothetical protein